MNPFKPVVKATKATGKFFYWSLTGNFSASRESTHALAEKLKKMAQSRPSPVLGTFDEMCERLHIDDATVKSKRRLFGVLSCMYACGGLIAFILFLRTPFVDHAISNALLSLGMLGVMVSNFIGAHIRYFQCAHRCLYSFKDYMSHFYLGVKWDVIRDHHSSIVK